MLNKIKENLIAILVVVGLLVVSIYGGYMLHGYMEQRAINSDIALAQPQLDALYPVAVSDEGTLYEKTSAYVKLESLELEDEIKTDFVRNQYYDMMLAARNHFNKLFEGTPYEGMSIDQANKTMKVELLTGDMVITMSE